MKAGNLRKFSTNKGSKRKIAVVGSKGYIGGHLTNRLSLLGYNVIEFGRTNPVISPSGELNEELNGVETIVWAATNIYPSTELEHSQISATEIKNWRAFLESIIEFLSPVPRIVFLSSAGCTYTSLSLQYSESDLATGTNSYGKTKIEMENILETSGVSAVILRLTNVYGPNQPTGRGLGVIAEWNKALRTSKEISIFGDLSSYRDYIYIHDVIDALILLLNKKHVTGIFNLGTGEKTSLGDLVSIFENILDFPIEKRLFNTRTTDRNGYCVSIDKIMRELEWQPKIGIQIGIKHVLLGNNE